MTMQVHDAGSLHLDQSIVTVGAFDGVHRGHQALLQATARRAVQRDAASVAYTFDPPPRTHFRGEPVLTQLEEKLEHLAEAGITYAVVARFTDHYARRPAADFLDELVQLGATEIWVGADFRFGAGRRGGPELLAERFTVKVFPTVLCAGRVPISSSRVRDLLAREAYADASALLGRVVGAA
jgi:riboflavin kinase/FMN adenylyltransferase